MEDVTGRGDRELLNAFHRAMSDLTAAAKPLEDVYRTGAEPPNYGDLRRSVDAAASRVAVITAEMMRRVQVHQELLSNYEKGVDELRRIGGEMLAEIRATNSGFFSSLARGHFKEARRWGVQFVDLAQDPEPFGPEAARSITAMVPYIEYKLDEIERLG